MNLIQEDYIFIENDKNYFIIRDFTINIKFVYV